MTRVSVLFMDGVGLGELDPDRNPLAAASMPTLERLLDGQRLTRLAAPFEGEQASLVAVDACLDIPGLPQSASGQAALLTGRNVPGEIGEHYGPKPNPAIIAILQQDNLFLRARARGLTATLLNAYPPRYFDAIRTRRRIYSSIPLAVTAAGLPLLTADDLRQGRALSADFTGEGWLAQPGFPPAPAYSPNAAGRLWGHLSSEVDMAWFDYWLSDYAGHRGTLRQAVDLLQSLDAVLAGLLEAWDISRNLIVMTSDHGNLEDRQARGHTRNPVPAMVIGPPQARREFLDGMEDLTDFTPAILRVLDGM
jgi:hypothetical protein